MVFVDFDKENINIQDFHQNISNRARPSAFFMYINFLLEIKSSWRNLEFSVGNVAENMVIQVFCVWIEHSHYVFDSISTLKSRFLHDDLISSKKSVYKKNAEERA